MSVSNNSITKEEFSTLLDYSINQPNAKCTNVKVFTCCECNGPSAIRFKSPNSVAIISIRSQDCGACKEIYDELLEIKTQIRNKFVCITATNADNYKEKINEEYKVAPFHNTHTFNAIEEHFYLTGEVSFVAVTSPMIPVFMEANFAFYNYMC